MHQTLKNLLYAFVARDNPAKQQDLLLGVPTSFEGRPRHATIDQFLLVCEKLIYKWQQVQFNYDFRNDKRTLGPLATEVGEHCEGCGNPNHKRRDCTSGHDPKHPNFNEEGKWVGCIMHSQVGNNVGQTLRTFS